MTVQVVPLDDPQASETVWFSFTISLAAPSTVMVPVSVWFTVTVTFACALPALLVAVSVYVVVCVGLTLTEFPVTVPTPGAIANVQAGAHDTSHASVELCPGLIVPGVAVNELIFGAWVDTVTVIVPGASFRPLLVGVAVMVAVPALTPVMVVLVPLPVTDATAELLDDQFAESDELQFKVPPTSKLAFP